MRQHTNRGTISTKEDIVFTSNSVAQEIVGRYHPTGIILDPCRGDGAFWGNILGAEWCEITEGKDFFSWEEPVDWIIGNPPYSIINRWLEHSFLLAENIVYLLPVAKIFGSRMRLRMVKEYGGIVEIWAPWTGREIGFDFG